MTPQDFHQKNVSSLSDHKLHKKKGIVAIPMNDALVYWFSVNWTNPLFC